MNRFLPTLLCSALVSVASAQLSTNPDKFLGNITTEGQVEYGNEKFYTLWNQITPENESKWLSVEGTRNSYNWGGCDRAYNYAKEHNFPFKFHTLVWGSQYPTWIKNLSAASRYEAIVKWMDAIKKRYPDLKMIDVVNEAVQGHQDDTPLMMEALGGAGVTGYDWIIKAFEMAYERWPDAILIYNDFNTFQWNTDEYIDLVKTLRDAGAPIDAYGCQSHDMLNYGGTDVASTFKSSMDKMHNTLMMPMYSTEYDVGTTNDALQLKAYQQQIPYMWEKDYCAGITLWGYIYGHTWTTGGNSGIIKDGNDRPAMKWLREYMQSDKAKNAKSPFPGMVKEASLYVKPATLAASKGEPLPIEVRARLKTKTIDHIDLYVDNKLYTTLTKAPYSLEYTPASAKTYNLKAVLTATDGTTFERLSSFRAFNQRSPYKGAIEIPGILEAENFDDGGEGLTFHDSDTKNEGGTNYRTNIGGVDIGSGNGGYVIGYTAAGEWLEYTIDVKERGMYKYEATVSAGIDGAAFTLSLVENGSLTTLKTINVPNTSSWDTYQVVTGTIRKTLPEGLQRLRITIDGSYVNIDKIEFKRMQSTGISDTQTDEDEQNSPSFSLSGQRVGEGYRGIIVKNGRKHLTR